MRIFEMKRGLTMILGATLMMSAGTGCKKLAEKVAEKAAEKAMKEVGAPGSKGTNAVGGDDDGSGLNYFEDASSVKAAYKAKIGGPVRIFEALIYPPAGKYVGTRFIAEVQNPTKKLEADKYTLQSGDWKDTRPIKWTGKMPTEKDLQAQSFDLESIDLGLIPKLVKDAKDQLKYDDAKVSHIVLKMNLPFENAIRWRVYVSSERRNGSVVYDVAGKFVKKYE
jgi:hypothetical protein